MSLFVVDLRAHFGFLPTLLFCRLCSMNELLPKKEEMRNVGVYLNSGQCVFSGFFIYFQVSEVDVVDEVDFKDRKKTHDNVERWYLMKRPTVTTASASSTVVYKSN